MTTSKMLLELPADFESFLDELRYILPLPYRHEHGLALNAGLKSFLGDV